MNAVQFGTHLKIYIIVRIQFRLDFHILSLFDSNHRGNGVPDVDDHLASKFRALRPKLLVTS